MNGVGSNVTGLDFACLIIHTNAYLISVLRNESIEFARLLSNEEKSNNFIFHIKKPFKIEILFLQKLRKQNFQEIQVSL